MTPTRVTPNGVSWEAAGRAAARAIAGFDAVVLISDDTAAAFGVACGMASARGPHQRVILADLVGNLPAVTSLVADDDPHGIAESFEYGVSLSRVAHPTGTDQLLVMPSGDGEVEKPDILGSPRWARLAAACRENGTMLLVLARSTAPALGELVASLDGAVVVGRTSLDPAPPFLVLHRVRRPVSDRRLPSVDARAGRNRGRTAGIAAAVLVSALAGGYLAWRAYAASMIDEAPPAIAMNPVAPAPVVPAPPPEPVPANAWDSASATGYAVEIVSANTRDGANFELARNRGRLPGVTIAPTVVGAELALWYKVIGGAYRTREQADSLLRASRQRQVISDSAGMLVQVPFAWLIDSVPPRVAVGTTVRKYVAQGLPAYALVQADGRAMVYVGAFGRGSESSALAEELRAAGLSPVLVYRTGRPL